MNAARAMEILRAIDPDTTLVVSEQPKANPFYSNSDRMPEVGDIVEITGYFGDKFRYVYTAETRRVGMNNQYATNWISLTHGHADTGPVSKATADRKLLSSIPE